MSFYYFVTNILSGDVHDMMYLNLTIVEKPNINVKLNF